MARKLLLLLTTVSLSVLAVEVVFRVTRPQRAFRAASELENFRLNPEDLTRHFEIDPGFGFRPILGGELYSEYGTRANEYVIEQPTDKTRLLFLGDSVTARGHIVEAIRDLYGDERYEYWNAGVESFNTVQEVNYYRRYNAAVMPDHVILTFHLNDFGTTPIAFMNREAPSSSTRRTARCGRSAHGCSGTATRIGSSSAWRARPQPTDGVSLKRCGPVSSISAEHSTSAERSSRS